MMRCLPIGALDSVISFEQRDIWHVPAQAFVPFIGQCVPDFQPWIGALVAEALRCYRSQTVSVQVFHAVLCGYCLRYLLSHLRLCLQPIVECVSIVSPSLLVEFVGTMADLLLKITGGFDRCVDRLSGSGYCVRRLHCGVTPLQVNG